MRLKLTYSRPDGSAADLAVTVDADCTVGHLADRLAASDPAGPGGEGATLAYGSPSGPITLDRRSPVIGAGIQSGMAIALAAAPAQPHGDGSGAATLTVHHGPDAGRTFELPVGSTTIGRGRQSGVQLSDPMVSTLHARVIVGEHIEIVDENSSNGILMGGQQVTRVLVTPDDQILLGENTISIQPRRAPIGGTGSLASGAATIEFNRSPRVDPVYEGRVLAAPDVPEQPKPQRLPILQMLMPLVMGALLLAVMKNRYMVVFMAMSPFMLLAGWLTNKRATEAQHKAAVEAFHANLADLLARGRSAHDEERARREVEHPGASDAADAIGRRSELLWTRRPEHASFMEVRLGLGHQPSRLTIDVQAPRNGVPDLVRELEDVTGQFVTVDRVPVVGSFDRSGSLGVSGPGEAMLSIARGLVIQLVALHSPAELVVCGVASASSAGRWEWLKWLPHATSDHSPLASPHLASTPPACAALVAELTDLISERAGEPGGADRSVPLPRVVIVVEGDAPIERSVLVNLAEIGPPHGVHLVWLAPSTSLIPAACRAYIEVDHTSGTVATGRVVEAELAHPVLVEPINESNAMALARSLAPLVDSGALIEDQSDLPASVSFLADAGPELAESSAAVLERWRESRSVFPPSEFPPGVRRPPHRRSSGLRALVGRGRGDNVYLDLRIDGPHALVGGTTGSGKSEFLQSWILGMATAYSPQRVTFLFVDYKGGAAFADCVKLPHCVGLVTDLSPRLVRRALASLRAELRHREHLLNRHSAKDLIEMETSGNPDTPPSLVIVVDEFAALVQEVPEFVDGVVDVAQRGRSLGLHLILATQRPAGVIKDNLRANTNLRIALRVADEDDSQDVVGSKVAASFDPAIPGRGVAKTGPGRLTAFQAGYLGGWTRSEAPEPTIGVEQLGFLSASAWEMPEPAAQAVSPDPGPTDIERLVERVIDAADLAGLPEPRRPWLPELAPVYDLAQLQLPRKDTELAFGVIDDPDAQEQRVVSFHPDLDGNMAVYGTGGTGKSVFLRTIAVSAGLTVRGGPCVVYGIDFGSRGLTMLEALPHVGSIIGGDDIERIARLLREIRHTVDERAARYAAVQAGTIGEYRSSAGQLDEPRVLILLDGMGAFRSLTEGAAHAHLMDLFQSIAVDGRQVGVHVVVSADRANAVPMSLASAIQRNLVLRLSAENDLITLGAPLDAFTRETPPGRGYMEDEACQVAVFGGSQSVAVQAAATERLARRLEKEGVVPAPAIRRLPEHVALKSLPTTVGAEALPAFALADETLGPLGFDPTLPILISGPAGSGRTTAVKTLVASWRAVRPDTEFVLFGQRRPSLATVGGWGRSAAGPDQAAELARQLRDELEALNWSANVVAVIEGIGEFLKSPAETPLAELLAGLRRAGLGIIAEGETPTLSGTWPLLAPVKSARHGIALQPDAQDGDSLFQTSFPRVRRADFPVGRGFYVRAGRVARMQVAVS